MIRKMATTAVFLCMSAGAFGQSIPAKCHQYYELFRATETYEDAGMVAEKMDNEGCWPAVQAGPAAPEPEASQLPAITDCETLAPHIVQMTVDQASTGNPVILRLYDTKPLTKGCSSHTDSSRGTFTRKRHDVVRDGDVLAVGIGQQGPRLVEA